MRLATIDPHCHKVQTKFYQIPKFGVNRPNSKQDTAIWKCPNVRTAIDPVLTASALHTAAEPAVRSAVKILVSQRNDTIKAFFFAANKNKNSAQVPLASSSS